MVSHDRRGMHSVGRRAAVRMSIYEVQAGMGDSSADDRRGAVGQLKVQQLLAAVLAGPAVRTSDSTWLLPRRQRLAQRQPSSGTVVRRRGREDLRRVDRLAAGMVARTAAAQRRIVAQRFQHRRRLRADVVLDEVHDVHAGAVLRTWHG